MADFGDEFIIESFKVPWLIWIQLMITILLILLLFFGFSIFTSDPTSTSSADASPSTASAAPTHRLPKPSSSRRRANLVNQRVRRDEETIGELIVEEDRSEEEESPLKDSIFVRIFRFSNHPCNYLGHVKRAFLKCFGLDPSSELSRRHEKREYIVDDD